MRCRHAAAIGLSPQCQDKLPVWARVLGRIELPHGLRERDELANLRREASEAPGFCSPHPDAVSVNWQDADVKPGPEDREGEVKAKGEPLPIGSSLQCHRAYCAVSN